MGSLAFRSKFGQIQKLKHAFEQLEWAQSRPYILVHQAIMMVVVTACLYVAWHVSMVMYSSGRPDWECALVLLISLLSLFNVSVYEKWFPLTYVTDDAWNNFVNMPKSCFDIFGMVLFFPFWIFFWVSFFGIIIFFFGWRGGVAVAAVLITFALWIRFEWNVVLYTRKTFREMEKAAEVKIKMYH